MVSCVGMGRCSLFGREDGNRCVCARREERCNILTALGVCRLREQDQVLRCDAG